MVPSRALFLSSTFWILSATCLSSIPRYLNNVICSYILLPLSNHDLTVEVTYRAELIRRSIFYLPPLILGHCMYQDFHVLSPLCFSGWVSGLLWANTLSSFFSHPLNVFTPCFPLLYCVVDFPFSVLLFILTFQPARICPTVTIKQPSSVLMIPSI